MSEKYPNRQPNKRLRKAARSEVSDMLASIETRDRVVIRETLQADAQRWQTTADRLYGAQKYGRDVSQTILIPQYIKTPPEAPEHGFRLIRVDGACHLWHNDAWVRATGAMMRELGNSDLRILLAETCAFQEARRWSLAVRTLRFRDQTVNVQMMYQQNLNPEPQ